MRPVLLLGAILLCLEVSAQYKSDNKDFKTIYPQFLCKELASHTDYLLLDVRSPGEYGDSSSSAGLNLGHLKGALNIDIRQVGNRISDIASYRNKPVYVYCSHSQRSRRVSKMLADSGFTQVNNINGGITSFYLLDDPLRTCIASMIETSNRYTVISPADLCKKLSSKDNFYLLDVRSDSAWNHISLNPKTNAYGSFTGTHHISLDALPSKMNELPGNKEIIITDLNGGDASLAARKLVESGYEHVSVLMEGMDRYFLWDRNKSNCGQHLYQPAVSYAIMSPAEFSRFIPSAKNRVLLDIRTPEEFTNTHQQTYRNIGHLKNAVNYPLSSLDAKIKELDRYKSSQIIIYEFAGGTDAYAAADKLVKNGFKNVIVLAGGLFNIRWSAYNTPGMELMKDWVVDVPEVNR